MKSRDRFIKFIIEFQEDFIPRGGIEKSGDLCVESRVKLEGKSGTENLDQKLFYSVLRETFKNIIEDRKEGRKRIKLMKSRIMKLIF